MASPILLCIILCGTTLPLFVCGSGGFSIDLIHRDSPKSPSYNPSLSHSDRLRAAARRSIARANSFRRLPFSAISPSSYPAPAPSAISPSSSPAPAPGPLSATPIDSRVVPGNYEYLMSVNIGMPPFEIIAIADTGSDLIWTQCLPCVECYNQTEPIFDPKSSSSYGTVSCSSDSCLELPDGSCTNGSRCQYEYGYGDGSHTEGLLSTETFTFDSEGKRNVSIPNLLFGCSHDTGGTFDPEDGGLVGLGGGPLSLVSQLGSSIDHKFSYCLVPYAEANTSSSLLNFGDRAEVVGPNAVTTPIIPGDPVTFYYLSLEGVTVADEKFAAAVSQDQAQGNVIIDSGTTLTILDDSTVKSLVDKLTAVLKYPTMPDSDFDLCFNVSSVTDLDLPDMTFQFSGAPLKLSPMNTFVEVDAGVLCLAVVSNGGDGGFQIFGNIAQQNWHIGYDLGASMLTLAPADCAKL